MPVDFLTTEQKARYGHFFGDPSELQLARYFHLDETDLSIISNRRGDQNRFGFALQLTSVRFLGTFISDFTRIPTNVQLFVAQQLLVKDITVLVDYAQRDTTKREHTALIRKHYGYNEFNESFWAFRLSRLLYTRAWISNERPSLMFDFATAWFIRHKVLLPGASTLTRLISKIRERTSNLLWQRLASLPSANQKDNLETLLHVPDGQRISMFDHYRKGPVTISGPSFNAAVERFKALKAFGVAELDFSHIPPVRLKNLARYAGMTSINKIARMPDEKRIAILVAYVKIFEIIAFDEAIDVLDLLITSIAGAAKKIGQKKRLRTLKDLDRCALALAEVCALILNERTQGSQLRETIFSQIPKEKLAESITTVKDLARPYDDNFHDELVAQYGRVRRFLPKLLNDIDFKAAPAGEITMRAFNYLIVMGLSRKQILEEPPLDIITKPWKRLVFDSEGQVSKRGYTLCFLEKLQDALRRRDIYAENSDRWGDSRAKLLRGPEWKAKRIQVCRALGHPANPQKAITKLIHQLDTTYKQVSNKFNDNDNVNLDHSGKHPSLTITNLNRLDEPSSLTQLSEQVNGLLPSIDLAEVLLELHAKTGFADEFTHVSESKARVEDLPISISAVLMAEACNIGIEPLIKHHIPALTRHRLNWVKQNYLRAETIVRANARLVDYQTTLPIAKRWGGGEVASADGMRFVTPIRTINSGRGNDSFHIVHYRLIFLLLLIGYSRKN